MTLESSSQVAPGAAAGVNHVEGERLCGVCLCLIGCDGLSAIFDHCDHGSVEVAGRRGAHRHGFGDVPCATRLPKLALAQEPHISTLFIATGAIGKRNDSNGIHSAMQCRVWSAGR